MKNNTILTKEDLITHISHAKKEIKHLTISLSNINDKKLKLEESISHHHTIHNEYDRQLSMLDGRYNVIKPKKARKKHKTKTQPNKMSEKELLNLLRKMPADERKLWLGKVASQLNKVTQLPKG